MEKIYEYMDKEKGYTYRIDKNCAVFSTENDTKSLVVFYPGAKVETSAYLPLCAKLAENGINSIIVDMPFKLAFLGINSADKVIETIDRMNLEIENYYIAGHSLGGVARSSYAYKNPDKIKGVILLASYSTKNLNEKNVPVLSVYGTNDGILNMASYEKYRYNISDYLTELVIEGGNHAFFGMYGNQDGDRSAIISHEKQIETTADEIIRFINNN